MELRCKLILLLRCERDVITLAALSRMLEDAIHGG